jgi:putative membrane protein
MHQPRLATGTLAVGLFLLCVVPRATLAAPPAAPGSLDDHQILGVLQTADLGEIQIAQLAKGRAKSKEVATYAEMIISDHTAAEGSVKNAIQATGPTATSPLSHTVRQDTQRTLDATAARKAAAFDRAYLESQVTMHTSLLQAIDTQLLPQAKRAEDRDLVTGIRPRIAEHLSKAQELLRKLSSR